MELDFEMLQQIVAMLPPEWQRHLATVLMLWPVFSLVIGVAKRVVADTVTSPQARHWWDAFFKVCDLIAINTKGMDLHPLAEPKSKKDPKR